ncbi:MAG TPA: aminomethyl-transferring glycine dehydrogenase [Phnomibacter sp.]|nr:aminomethyl-transferring glycine dehydrogenase [Phnomibacter sp.]
MNLFEHQSSEFHERHIGTMGSEHDMLASIGVDSLDTLIDRTVPASIRLEAPLNVPDSLSEAALLQHLKDLSLKNTISRNYIGQGYYDTLTPSVILRNIFENPGWYTQYTPYQAEISQGRLESLLNYQTMVSDLTGLPISNASLLDEATAAAEAMNMLFHHVNKGPEAQAPNFFVDQHTFPQVIDVVITRATPLGIQVVIGDYKNATIDNTYFGALIQYPNSIGSIEDYRSFIAAVHAVGGGVAMGTDLMALTLLTSPGELGADVAYGSSQRFGVPLGYGGPHAAFFAAKDEFKRALPGRIIGVSIDATGNRALRMALQTREQHIKREKATSNICTAQALLSNMAAMYAIYHGPAGLKNIAKRISLLTSVLGHALSDMGYTLSAGDYFDTLQVKVDNAERIRAIAESYRINFLYANANTIGISLDETTTQNDVLDIAQVFAIAAGQPAATIVFSDDASLENIPTHAVRTSAYLQHPVYNTHRSESQMMRYIKSLENKDLSLNTSMISLGSCTMKLNAATEMIPLSWNHWSKVHPFAPAAQAAGYHEMMKELNDYLCAVTGFDYCWLQPNSGAQGEFAGLLAIRNYHIKNNNPHRNVVLIPISAHGTNPASAVMVGMKVVVVKALENGYIDVEDFKAKAIQHSANLAGTMITYPSTYGIFEESVKEICDLVHEHGGQVYMDGANMNAQVGLTSPATIGADVCHLNLHKTFAIPHGGGGPGMGPICFRSHLKDVFMNLPQEAEALGNDDTIRSVSAAPFGSASILLISYAYIRMLGARGLRKATEYAILNANYMRARLQEHYPILYTGSNGTCAHEFIADLRPFKNTAGVEAADVAKRLMDYGFHAPTLSFPVAGTIMIEPTESEDKAELDRFCDAMIAIRQEIRDIEEGRMDKLNNPLKNAPHTQQVVTADEWTRPYSRQQAAFPLPYVSANKFWPSVSRVNDTHGDRNLICTCEPVESFMEAES